MNNLLKTETLAGHTFTYYSIRQEKVSTRGMHYINDTCPVCEEVGLYIQYVDGRWVRYCTFCEVHHYMESDWKYERRR